MSDNTAHTTGTRNTVHKAGAFDIRNIIAALLGIYGIVLLICSVALDPGVNPDTGVEKSATDNLWTGLVLVVVAVVMFLWARLNPVVVDESLIDESALPEGGNL